MADELNQAQEALLQQTAARKEAEGKAEVAAQEAAAAAQWAQAVSEESLLIREQQEALESELVRVKEENARLAAAASHPAEQELEREFALLTEDNARLVAAAASRPGQEELESELARIKEENARWAAAASHPAQQELESELARLREDNARLAAAASRPGQEKLKSELARLQEDNARLAAAVGQPNEAATALRKELIAAKDQHQQVQRALEAELARLLEQNGRLQASAGASKELSAMQNQNSELQGQLAVRTWETLVKDGSLEAADRLAAAEEAAAQLEDRLAASCTEAAELRQRLGESLLEAEQLRGRLTAGHAEATEKLLQAELRRQQQVDELAQQLQAAGQESDELRKKLRRMEALCADVQGGQAELQSELAQAQAACQESQTQMARMQQRVAVYEEIATAAEGETAGLHVELGSALAQHGAALAEVAALKEQLRQSQSAREDAESSARVLGQQVALARDELAQQAQQLDLARVTLAHVDQEKAETAALAAEVAVRLQEQEGQAALMRQALEQQDALLQHMHSALQGQQSAQQAQQPSAAQQPAAGDSTPPPQQTAALQPPASGALGSPLGSGPAPPDGSLTPEMHTSDSPTLANPSKRPAAVPGNYTAKWGPGLKWNHSSLASTQFASAQSGAFRLSSSLAGSLDLLSSMYGLRSSAASPAAAGSALHAGAGKFESTFLRRNPDVAVEASLCNLECSPTPEPEPSRLPDLSGDSAYAAASYAVRNLQGRSSVPSRVWPPSRLSMPSPITPGSSRQFGTPRSGASMPLSLAEEAMTPPCSYPLQRRSQTLGGSAPGPAERAAVEVSDHEHEAEDDENETESASTSPSEGSQASATGSGSMHSGQERVQHELNSEAALSIRSPYGSQAIQHGPSYPVHLGSTLCQRSVDGSDDVQVMHETHVFSISDSPQCSSVLQGSPGSPQPSYGEVSSRSTAQHGEATHRDAAGQAPASPASPTASNQLPKLLLSHTPTSSTLQQPISPHAKGGSRVPHRGALHLTVDATGAARQQPPSPLRQASRRAMRAAPSPASTSGGDDADQPTCTSPAYSGMSPTPATSELPPTPQSPTPALTLTPLQSTARQAQRPTGAREACKALLPASAQPAPASPVARTLAARRQGNASEGVPGSPAANIFKRMQRPGGRAAQKNELSTMR